MGVTSSCPSSSIVAVGAVRHHTTAILSKHWVDYWRVELHHVFVESLFPQKKAPAGRPPNKNRYLKKKKKKTLLKKKKNKKCFYYILFYTWYNNIYRILNTKKKTPFKKKKKKKKKKS